MTAAHRIDCPFTPCDAWWWVGSDNWQVPYHNVRGSTVPPVFAHFKCPGALVNFRHGTNVVLPVDLIGLAGRAQTYRERLREWQFAEAERLGRRPPGDAGSELPRLIPEGRPADLDQPDAQLLYFPGRPADAPEPGPDEPPAQPVEIGTGHHLGRSVMTNAHNTARELAALAVNQMGLTQDILARITSAVDEALALAEAAASQINSVAALVDAAVGSGEVAFGGRDMAEYTALAKSTITDQSDGITMPLRLAHQRVADAHRQVELAVQHGKVYVAAMS